MKKQVLSVTLALGLAVSSLGVPAFAEEAGEFVVRGCIASEPETLDPNLESSVDGATYAMHLFEGLMKYKLTDNKAAVGDDENDTVKLLETDFGQAESYDVSEDGLTYTFHLRDGITWSDGQPVTAKDFEYSWKRIVDPANAADYGYILDGIVTNAAAIQAGEAEPDTLGITAVDDKTLEITLEAECPYFIGLCAFAALMPLRQDVIEEYGQEWTDPGKLVSNGAYVLSDWVHDSYLEMTRNESFYEQPGPDKIVWYLNNSETSQLAAFQAGEYDFFDAVPVDQITALKEQGICHSAPQVGTYYLYLSADQIPDWRVRAAISLAIDRDNIVENVTQAGQVPATGITADGITTYDGQSWTEVYGDFTTLALSEMYPDADLETYSGRCELAQQLLEEAVADGYDTSATIDYEYNTNEAHKAIGEAVQSDVASVLGLDIALNNSEWQTYTNNLGEGKFGMARLGWIADYDDAQTYIELFTNGNSYNYGNWVSDEYTELVAKAKTLPGSAERDELLSSAEKLMFGEGGYPVAPVYFYTQTYCVNDAAVKNVGWTPLGYFMFHYATQE
ncbi:MAG: peptide ABC transporter substrate-binding protein [Blautia sp.]|nr:peptide ABC transporter substrate-binding protein [Blautia sp.]